MDAKLARSNAGQEPSPELAHPPIAIAHEQNVPKKKKRRAEQNNGQVVVTSGQENYYASADTNQNK